MPKRTRLQKLRSEERLHAHALEQKNVIAQPVVLNPHFKTDLTKSILLAVFITLFEIALYFVYYQRVWERR